jgi:hypothetical protein
MRSVSTRLRRVASAFVLSTVLLAHAPVVLAECVRDEGRLTVIETIIVWLQSRFSVPGG